MEFKREHHINFWYVIVAFFAILLIQDFLIHATSVKVIPYSEFQALLHDRKITDVVVGATTITGKFRDPENAAVPSFSVVRVDGALAKELTEAGVTFSGEPGPGLFGTILGWFMPAVGFFLLW